MATSAASPSERSPRRMRLAILISSSTTSTLMRTTMMAGNESKMRRYGNPDISACFPVHCMSAATMRDRDRRGDRQAQPGTPAGACLVGPREALERARKEVRREPGTLIAHVQLDAILDRLCAQVHGALA